MRRHARTLVEDDAAVAETVRRGLVVMAILPTSLQMLARLAHSLAKTVTMRFPDLESAGCIRLRSNRRACQTSPQVPVLMVTGRRRRLMTSCMVSTSAPTITSPPFEVRELLARLRAVTRRAANAGREILNFEDLELDRLRREVRCGETRLRVTPKEFGVLELRMLEDGGVASRRVLLEQVWEVDYDPGTNVVDVQITHLRTKLRQAGSRVRIANVRGTGFRLTLDTTAESGALTEDV
jgi:DNA-binding response OmpR family regulator